MSDAQSLVDGVGEGIITIGIITHSGSVSKMYLLDYTLAGLHKCSVRISWQDFELHKSR